MIGCVKASPRFLFEEAPLSGLLILALATFISKRQPRPTRTTSALAVQLNNSELHSNTFPTVSRDLDLMSVDYCFKVFPFTAVCLSGFSPLRSESAWRNADFVYGSVNSNERPPLRICNGRLTCRACRERRGSSLPRVLLADETSMQPQRTFFEFLAVRYHLSWTSI